ncbi:MAG: hypothetical protein ACE5I2_04200 [Anaerolineae bacterium]
MVAKRERLRSGQEAQLDRVLAEVDEILLVGTEKASISQAGLDGRRRFQALQRAQLEAPAVLGKAERRVLLGQARPYHRQRFRATQMAQLDVPSVLTETDRMLLIGARGNGWRQRLRSLGQVVAASLDYAQARLKIRRAAGQSERAAEAEGPPAAVGPAEPRRVGAMASPTRREQAGLPEASGMPSAAKAPTEAALILARAFGGEDLAGRVPIVTAALTELGAPKDEFGLMLRVGSRAPRAQAGASEFTVTGLGLTELSHGLSRWLKDAGKTDIPLQVIDDGSGKIKVLIS